MQQSLKIGLIITVVFVVGIGGSILLYDASIGGTCTISVTGYAANITLSAFNATATCDKIIVMYPKELIERVIAQLELNSVQVKQQTG